MGCLSMIVVDGNAARFPYRDEEFYDLRKLRVLSAQSAWRVQCLHENVAKQVRMSTSQSLPYKLIAKDLQKGWLK